MGSLIGKCALVTGGGQGIGKAIARGLLESGCDVAIHYHSSADGAQELSVHAEKLRRRFSAFAADLTKEDEAKDMVAKAANFLGGLDVLVNNAGGLVGRRTIDAIDLSFWQSVADINLTSLVVVTREAIPFLAASAAVRGGASIVNLSSLAGRKGGHGGSLAYSTMKGAILTFTRGLSAEVAAKGIRVNAVAPGLILGTYFHNTFTTKESADATVAQIPLGRAGNVDDVARPVIFLASEFDGFITGETIDINGGIYCA
jgi:3-oxoacyl-[acyl-carrier protein] reductase